MRRTGERFSLRQTALLLVSGAVVLGAIAYFILSDASDLPSTGGIIVVPREQGMSGDGRSAEALDVNASSAPEVRAASEPVDTVWAPPARTAVDKSLKRIPFLTAAGPLKVHCATTICEATGTLPPLMDAEGRRQFLELLKSPVVTEPLTIDGLRLRADRPAAVGNAETFVLYIERSEPPSSSAP